MLHTRGSLGTSSESGELGGRDDRDLGLIEFSDGRVVEIKVRFDKLGGSEGEPLAGKSDTDQGRCRRQQRQHYLLQTDVLEAVCIRVHQNYTYQRELKSLTSSEDLEEMQGVVSSVLNKVSYNPVRSVQHDRHECIPKEAGT